MAIMGNMGNMAITESIKEKEACFYYERTL